jgi:tripartite-type tricarboxylate transporter receptor subunit TctC
MQRRHLLAAAGAVGAGIAARGALAQDRNIRIVVPFAAGGPIDATARLLADKVRDTLGTVLVENRPGGGGGIGVGAVAKAPPDGLTLGIAAVAMHAINPWLGKLPYDPIRDFAPVTQMVRVPNVLVMNAEVAQRLNIRTLQDFVAYAKRNPGRLNYGSGGMGSAGHLGGELFKQRAGIFAVHIPYGGGNPAQLALLAGQVDFNLDNLATAAPNIRSGKLLPLAVTTAQRSPLMPEVPAMAETWPGFEVDTWWGLMAPAGTPPDVVARLNAAFVAALRAPDVKSRFADLMAEPAPSTPAEFSQLIQRELARYEKVVKASGVKAP